MCPGRTRSVFVGHAFLAFGLVALAAVRFGATLGVDPARQVPLGRGSITVAIALGLVAALAASLPDLDLFQTVAVVVTDPQGGPLIDQLRTASRATHRLTTHSLVLAVPIAAGIALWSRKQWVGTALFVAVVAAVAVASGAVGAAIIGAVVIAAAGVGTLADRWALDARATGVAALVGLAIHPFTDLFTGEPPAIAAPVDVTLLGPRIAPFADPFANLLLATGVELGAIWVGVGVAAALTGRSLRELIHPVAAVGVGYALVGRSRRAECRQRRRLRRDAARRRPHRECRSPRARTRLHGSRSVALYRPRDDHDRDGRRYARDRAGVTR